MSDEQTKKENPHKLGILYKATRIHSRYRVRTSQEVKGAYSSIYEFSHTERVLCTSSLTHLRVLSRIYKFSHTERVLSHRRSSLYEFSHTFTSYLTKNEFSLRVLSHMYEFSHTFWVLSTTSLPHRVTLRENGFWLHFNRGSTVEIDRSTV